MRFESPHVVGMALHEQQEEQQTASRPGDWVKLGSRDQNGSFIPPSHSDSDSLKRYDVRLPYLLLVQ